MLIKFSVENWMSFRDPVSFSMIASRERQHGDRIPKLAKYDAKILPVAAIYGGNASGKTNFFKALNFAKILVVKGTQPESSIAVDAFRLDNNSLEKPSHFIFELLINNEIYEFSFSVNHKAVLSEKLVLISSYSEKQLYSRSTEKIEFDPTLPEQEFLKFAFRGTRDNQLFLTNSVSQKVNNFKPVYDWFKDCLDMVAPDSRFEPFEQFIDDEHPMYLTMNAMLPQLDTGITHLGGEEISVDNLGLPPAVKSLLQEDVKEGMTVRLMSDKNDRIIITRKNGELIAKKLVAYHPKLDGSVAKFEIRQESDGSQRVIDLLPLFLELSKNDSTKVFVIDELDRSLHTLLTRRLIETYLASCNANSRSQLLFTTHDVLLMDQDLLRRDEMWIAERNNTGSSSLKSFSDFKDVRYDKNVRKSYLQGRLGGIPHLRLAPTSMSQSKLKPEKELA